MTRIARRFSEILKVERMLRTFAAAKTQRERVVLGTEEAHG
jgi:hypothetical protein